MLCMLFAQLSVGPARAESGKFPEIDRVIEERCRGHLVPGVAVVIMRGEEVVHTFARGSNEDAPIGPETPFVIGSLSKLFTATAMMQLVDAGLVQLDAPVQQYLPDFRLADAESSKQITVRHLLHQSSGLPEDAPRATGSNLRLQDHVLALRQTDLEAAPGTRHVYRVRTIRCSARSWRKCPGSLRRILESLDLRAARDDALVYRRKRSTRSRVGRRKEHLVWFSRPLLLSL